LTLSIPRTSLSLGSVQAGGIDSEGEEERGRALARSGEIARETDLLLSESGGRVVVEGVGANAQVHWMPSCLIR